MGKIFSKELTEPNEAPHTYEELDQIRLVKEDGELVGWYRPSVEEQNEKKEVDRNGR